MTRGIVVVLAAVVLAAMLALGRSESFVNLPEKYPYWGWQGTPNEGRRCRNPDNTGCDTEWVNGRMVEKAGAGGPGGGKVVFNQNSAGGGISTEQFNDLNRLYNLKEYGWDNKISSILVPAGREVHAWQKEDREGSYIKFGPGFHDLTRYAFMTTFLGGGYVPGTGMTLEKNKKYDTNVCGSGNSTCWNDTISSLEVKAA